jgi:hypothetical protein
MSRHIYETRYRDRKVEVVIGFDCQLRYFFMTVMYTETALNAAVNSHGDDDDDTVVYSNLSDPEAGFARDLAHYRSKLASLGITVPESMFQQAEEDAHGVSGNREARHFDGDRVEDTGTSSPKASAVVSKDAAQMLIETINATGGLTSLESGLYAPVADPDWIDLAEAYFQACLEKAVEAVITDDANLSGT